MTFNQSGLSAGTAGRSRSDIVAGTAVTITNESPGTSNECELLSKPEDDDTAAISGSSPTWSITPKSGTWGSYRIRLTVDGDESIHTFTVRSPIRALQVGAHNEGANPNANLADVDPGTWVEDSETNEGGKNTGWWPGVVELYEAVEDSIIASSPGNPQWEEDTNLSCHSLPSEIVDQDRVINDSASYDYQAGIGVGTDNVYTVIAHVIHGSTRQTLIASIDIRRVSTASAVAGTQRNIQIATGWTLTLTASANNLNVNLANASGTNGVASVYATCFVAPNVAFLTTTTTTTTV